MPLPKPRYLSCTISNAQDGQTVKSIILTDMDISSAWLRRTKWLSDGIMVNQQRVSPRFIVHAGDRLTVRLTDPVRHSDLIPAKGPLDILFEDEDLIILNKAPHLPVHPGPGHYDDTIGNFLLDYYETSGKEGDFHPVHRIDKGTSGLLVVARHPFAQEQLKKQFQSGSFRRTYLALSHGILCPQEGTINLPIGRVDGSLIRREVRPDGQTAITHYKTICHGSACSLLHLNLETGRTHQIRVHLSHLGHPLIGDDLYDAPTDAIFTRPALHSYTLDILHPVTKVPLCFTAPPPQDFLSFFQSHFAIVPAL